jgi:hypothetical protein
MDGKQRESVRSDSKILRKAYLERRYKKDGTLREQNNLCKINVL